MKTSQKVTITKQWQIYLPELIRKQIELKEPTTADISIENGAIVIRPLQSNALSLAGSVPAKADVDVEHLRDQIDYSAI